MRKRHAAHKHRAHDTERESETTGYQVYPSCKENRIVIEPLPVSQLLHLGIGVELAVLVK